MLTNRSRRARAARGADAMLKQRSSNIQAHFTASMALVAIVALHLAATEAAAESYRVMLIGLVGPHRNSPERLLGVYPTYEAASAAALAWSSRSAKDDISLWRIDTVGSSGGQDATIDIDTALAQAKAALDALRKFAARGKATLLQGIKEYSIAVTDVWKRITALKDKLTNAAVGILDENIRKANQLIEGFNGEADRYNSLARETNQKTVSKITPIVAPGKISFQKVPFVDLSFMSQASRSPRVSVVGKTFEGKIGDDNVTLTFDEDRFTVSGDVSGSGSWRQIDSALAMETEASVYRGVISGEEIKGIRYPKSHEPYEEWSVSAAQTEADDRHDDVAIGTWLHYDETRNLLSTSFHIELRPNGEAVQLFHGSGRQRVGNWKRISDDIIEYTLPRIEFAMGYRPAETGHIKFESRDKGRHVWEDNGVWKQGTYVGRRKE